MSVLERLRLKRQMHDDIDGVLCIDTEALEIFLNAPYDILPGFQGPDGSRLKGGRGKDHPRYGRFIYALGKHYKPEIVVEVGSYAGGTGIGWGAAMKENGKGRLICVDNDTYSRGTYPTVTRKNVLAIGLPETQLELRNGNSRDIVPELAQELHGQVDIYLVDGDHTYEGALADIRNGLPMIKPAGLILVHDVDRGRRMDEETAEHPHPVYEAFHDVAREHGYQWCILKFIRKHLGVLQAQ